MMIAGPQHPGWLEPLFCFLLQGGRERSEQGREVHFGQHEYLNPLPRCEVGHALAGTALPLFEEKIRAMILDAPPFPRRGAILI